MTLAANTGQTPVSTRPSPVSVSLTSVAGNALIALFCMADANNGNNTESLSIGTTGGLTWTRQTQANGSGGAVCAIFTAPSGAGGNFSITVVDSDGLANGSAELAVVPVVFTDTSGGTPGVGATRADSVNIVTTVNNSWIWFNNFGSGTTNANQTSVYADASFDGGDTVTVGKWNTTTPTAGTTITPTQGGSHGTIIEVTPGTGGGSTVNGTATIAGAGSVSAPVVQRAPSTPAGVGSLSAPVVQGSKSTIAATGSLAAAVVQLAPATIAGAGSAAEFATQVVKATLTGAGVLTAVGGAAGAGGAFLAGVGGLTAGATLRAPATFAAAGALSARVTLLGSASLVGAGVLDINLNPCTVLRPDSGTTSRPTSGMTVYALASTARPSTGRTSRPNTGITDDPCS